MKLSKKSISTDTFILVLHTGRHAISHKPDYNSEKQKENRYKNKYKYK